MWYTFGKIRRGSEDAVYSVQELENLLNAAGADFQLIRQEVPILSAADAGPYYGFNACEYRFLYCRATGA